MTNKRIILAEADRMAAEAKAAVSGMPDWAGLEWIADPGWNTSRFRAVMDRMGAEWLARARRLCAELAIASEWNQ
jgi:hypothetical protein